MFISGPINSICCIVMMIYLFIFMDEIKVRDELTARSETQDLLMQLML